MGGPASWVAWAIPVAIWLGLTMPVFAQNAEPLEPLESFIGEWRGTAVGQAGAGKVTRRYAKVLGGRFIEEADTTAYPPQDVNLKGEVHQHLGMFSYDRQRKVLILRQFHIEGFVNRYKQVSANGATRLVFESEGFENFRNTWKARETYEFDGLDRFVETFELAPPGKYLQVYSRTELRRAR